MPDLTQNARKGRDMRPFQSVGIFSLPLRPYASAPGLKSRPSRRHCMYSAEAANSTSVEELIAVSTESWITPITKPMPTTCMATSLPMPNRLQASGMSSRRRRKRRKRTRRKARPG